MITVPISKRMCNELRRLQNGRWDRDRAVKEHETSYSTILYIQLIGKQENYRLLMLFEYLLLPLLHFLPFGVCVSLCVSKQYKPE